MPEARDVSPCSAAIEAARTFSRLTNDVSLSSDEARGPGTLARWAKDVSLTRDLAIRVFDSAAVSEAVAILTTAPMLAPAAGGRSSASVVVTVPPVARTPDSSEPRVQGRERTLQYLGVSGFGMAVGAHIGRYGWAIGGVAFPLWWRLTGGSSR